MDKNIIIENNIKCKGNKKNMMKERQIATYYTKKQVMKMLGIGRKTLDTLALPFSSVTICEGEYKKDVIYATDFIYWLCSQYKQHYTDKNKLELLMNKKLSDFFTL